MKKRMSECLLKLAGIIFACFVAAALIFTLQDLYYAAAADGPGASPFLSFACAALTAALSAALACVAGGRLEKSSRRVCFAVVLLCALIPRLLWLGAFDVTPRDDFRLYDSFARQLASGGFIGGGYVSLFPHTFGYPLVLSVFYRIFGADYHVALYLNVLLSGLTAALLFDLADRRFGRRAGAVSALLWAFWPSQIFYTALVCSEHLFVLLMLLSLRLFLPLLSAEKKSIPAFLGLGLFCAVMNAIRPVGVILAIAFVLIWLLAALRPGTRPAGALLPALLFALAFFLASQAVRTGISGAIGRDVAASPVGFNLYVGSNLEFSGQWNEADADVLSGKLNGGDFDAQEVQDEMLKLAAARLESQGPDNIKLLKRKFVVMWASDDEILSYMQSGLQDSAPGFARALPYLRPLCDLYYFAVLILAAVYALGAVRGKPNAALVLFSVVVLGFAALHLIVEVHGRYHFPAMILLALLAGAGLPGSRKTGAVSGPVR